MIAICSRYCNAHLIAEKTEARDTSSKSHNQEVVELRHSLMFSSTALSNMGQWTKGAGITTKPV